MAMLPHTAYGYVLNVARAPDAPGLYGATVAEAILDAIAALGLTGEVDYHAGDAFLIGQPENYLVGLAVDLGDGRTPPAETFNALRESVSAALGRGPGLTLFGPGCEMGPIGGFADLIESRGRVRFDAGRPVAITQDEDSWFIATVRDRLERT